MNRRRKLSGRNTGIVFFTVICSMIVQNTEAQSNIWDKWDKETIEKANTAKDFTSYTEEEKKVVFFMNLARLNGPLFAETLLDAYVDENDVENNSYLRSLYSDLKKLETLDPLIPEEDLSSVSVGHAEESGRTGHVGHKNFDKRFDPLIGNPYMGIGENCSYGHAEAVDIVITLLIDDGVVGVGHRENTLNPDFNSVGVAIREHKGYRFNCVIDFGKKRRSDLNSVPF